ncbi:MAG: hypothetical protein AVDCRST_MAG88-4209, partial [uncultured Thermomicrobiales bacterium]
WGLTTEGGPVWARGARPTLPVSGGRAWTPVMAAAEPATGQLHRWSPGASTRAGSASSWPSSRRPTPASASSWWWTTPAGTGRATSGCRPTSSSGSCRPTAPRPTRSSRSGSGCATTTRAASASAPGQPH